MGIRFIIYTLLVASITAAASENQLVAAENEPSRVIEVSVRSELALTEELNIAEITHDLITREMGEPEFKMFVQKVNKRFKDWSHEYDNNNLKQFLDDRLIALAPTVTSGKGKALRDFCQWLALYRVFSEPLPRYIQDISDEDKQRESQALR